MTRKREEPPTRDCAIQLMGEFQILHAGLPLHIGNRHDRALLAYLCMNCGKRIIRSELAELLWGTNDGRRHSLAQSLYRLTKALPQLQVERTPTEIFVSDLPGQVDALTLLETCRSGGDVSYLRYGEFLDGLLLSDATGFEEWRDETNASITAVLRRRLLSTLDEYERVHDLPAVVRTAQLLTHLAPYDEHAVCTLATALTATDSADLAIATLEDFIKRSNNDFAASVSPAQAILLFERLTSLADARHPTDAVAVPKPRFVGRTAELTTLKRFFESVQGGPISSLLLLGQPGVGKSRLAEQFLRLVTIKGGRVFCGQCTQPERRIPYSGIASALENGMRPADLVALPKQWSRILENLVPGTVAGDRHVVVRSEETSPRWLFEAVARMFESVCSLVPAVLCIDDLHWADSSTVALLSYLRRRIRDQRLLILLVSRTTDIRNNQAAYDLIDSAVEPIQVVRVEPLDKASLITLVQTVRDNVARGMTADDVELLVDQCGGNPFFLIELVRYFCSGSGRSFSFDDVRRSEPLYLPSTIEDFVADRVRRLPRTHRNVLDAVVVLGAHATMSAVATLAHENASTTLQALEDLSEQELIREDAGTFRVAHDLIRQGIYRRLSPVRRRELHRRSVALVSDNESRAVHADHAGLSEVAGESARQAARDATLLGSNVEADYYWGLSLKHLSGNEGARSVAVEYARFLLSAGRLEDGLQVISSRKYPGTRTSNDELGVLRTLMRLMKSLGNGRWTANLVAASAQDLLERLSGGAQNPTWFYVLFLLVEAGHDAGEATFVRELLPDILRFADAAGVSPGRAEALALGGRVLAFYGDRSEEALDLCTESLRVAKIVGRPHELAMAYQSMAAVDFLRGHLAEAARNYRAAFDVAETRGVMQLLQRICNNYGALLLEQNCLEQSRSMLDRSLSLCNQHDRMYAHANLAAWAVEVGDMDEVGYHGLAILEANRRLQAKWGTMAGNSFLGLSMVSAGDIDQAEALYTNLMQIGRSRSHAEDRSYEEIFRARFLLATCGRQAALDSIKDGESRMQRGSAFARARVRLEEARLVHADSPSRAREIAREILANPKLREGASVVRAARALIMDAHRSDV